LKIISFDIELDIAILEFENHIAGRSLSFGNSETLRYGQAMFTIGNALGFGLSVTEGIISVPLVIMESSGTERYVIHTSINLNRGGSGGPLFDMNGDVMGMMSFRIGNIAGNVQGVSFAIPSNVIHDYIRTIAL